MEFKARESLLYAAILVGLATSVLLGAEYVQPFPVMCAEGGGCNTVAQSAYSHILGIPMPLFGIVFFLALFGSLLVPALRPWLRPLGLMGALGGSALIAIQAFVLHAWCRFCVVVDVASLLIAALAWLPLGAPLRLPQRRTSSLAAGFHVAAIAAVVLGALGLHRHWAQPSLPVSATPRVPAFGLPAEPGVVTVVEFVDFQCPACRAQYQQLAPILDSYEEKLRVVLKNVPLPQHEHAVAAARAYCCADEKGKGRTMADRLFRADQLTARDCEEIAVQLGLDREEFKACVNSARTAQRLQDDMVTATQVGVRGLPTLWIGDERFEGVHAPETLRASIERALRRLQS